MAQKIAIIVALAIGSTLCWVQGSAAQTPHSSTQAQTVPGKSAAPPETHAHETGISQQDRQQMQANLNRMHALLNSMRANMSSMDPKDQPAMLSNIELWQLMLDHMDAMMKRRGNSH